MNNQERLLAALSELSIAELRLVPQFTEWLVKERGSAIYHPETETVEVPVEVLKRLDKRLAKLQVLMLILKLLIELIIKEQSRRN
ncbi:hypothetical protein ES703_20000 [subsurface metagenome]